MTDDQFELEDRLIVRYGNEGGDGIGQLTVEAHSFGFSGRSSAWFDHASLVGVANRLTTFPLPTEDPIEFSGGYGGEDEYIEDVGVRFHPLGHRGQVRARVHLASEIFRRDPGIGERLEVRLDLLTTYAHLERFAMDFRTVLADRASEAVLLSEVLQ